MLVNYRGAVVGASLGLLACGAQTSPPLGAGDAGRADAAGGTDSAGPCSEGPRLRGLTACLSRAPDAPLQPPPTDFVVVGAVPEDIARCAGAIRFPALVPVGELQDALEVPFAAWELEGTDGTSWLAQFAIGDVPESLLMAGDDVTLSTREAGSIETGPRGYVALAREGAPVVFLAYGLGPEFPSGHELLITAGALECGLGGGCDSFLNARAEANGETASIPTDESTSVGGWILRSDGYVDNGNCNPDLQAWSTEYLVGGYQLPP